MNLRVAIIACSNNGMLIEIFWCSDNHKHDFKFMNRERLLRENVNTKM